MRLDSTLISVEATYRPFRRPVDEPNSAKLRLPQRTDLDRDRYRGRMDVLAGDAGDGVPNRLHLDCRDCAARSTGLCRSLTPETMRSLASAKHQNRNLRAGQDLIGQGEACDAIFNLVEGWIMLYAISEAGRRHIVHFALAGAVLGLESMGQTTAKYGVQALTNVVVCEIPRKALAPESEAHPEIAIRLAWMMGRDRDLSFEHVFALGQHSARERVAGLLLELFVRSRAQWPGRGVEELALPLTQEHIADATGLTGVHVSRVLSRLRRDGILEFHCRRLKILDPGRLLKVCGVSPDSAMSWIDNGSAI